MKPYILHITSWYPNDNDHQLGVFIKKHIDAVKAQKGYNHVILNVSAALITEKDCYNLTIGSILSFPFRFKKTLKKITSTHSTPHAIHLHVAEKKAIAALLTKRYFKNIPLLITEHWTGFRTGKFKELAHIYRFIIKRTYKSASLVTTVSNALHSDLVNNGITINKHQPLGNVVEGCYDLAPAEDLPPWKIAFVADMVNRNKNLYGFVEAIEIIAKKHPIQVLTIGDGPDFIEMKELAKTKNLSGTFTFYGRKTNDFVLKTLGKAHFYVCSSFVETFSVATAEALFMGKPVVVTPCGGPEEFVNNTCGFIAKSTSPKDLSIAIEALIANYKQYDAKTIRNYVEQQFGKEAIGGALNKIYSNL